METTHEQQTQIYDLWYRAVALAKVTDNLQPPQRYHSVQQETHQEMR